MGRYGNCGAVVIVSVMTTDGGGDSETMSVSKELWRQTEHKSRLVEYLIQKATARLRTFDDWSTTTTKTEKEDREARDAEPAMPDVIADVPRYACGGVRVIDARKNCTEERRDTCENNGVCEAIADVQRTRAIDEDLADV